MKIKKLTALLAAVCLLLGVMTGCENAITIDGEGEASGETVGSGVIGLSVSTQNNPFFVSLVEGAEAQAKEDGVELVVVDAGDDAAKQASDVEDLISRNVSVLIVNPVDSDAVAPAVQNAVSQGIKVISVDRVVNGVDVDCQIASDNVAGAKMATEYLIEQIGEGAKVAEIQGTPGASATIDRGEGFHEAADAALNVVSSQTANFDRAEGMTVMENMLQSDSSIAGVFAHNDEMALGAVEAIAASGKDIKVVGFDATDDAVAAVESGRMLATVAQKPELMGATAVETAEKLIAGEEVEKSMPVEVELITK
ncbi:MAG: D-ribose ABC transporter substrate-binding protein [Ruminococcus sp.]|jgi:ribose transport system substrate-binding protein